MITKCSRCGSDKIDDERWENGWPNYGRIQLGFAARAFDALAGTTLLAESSVWRHNHPAMTKDEAQEVIFEWGSGYRYDSKDRYRLCYNCQKELLRTVGEFFNYPHTEQAT